MSVLPKVENVKFDLTIDELNRKIKYRAFNTKEHKVILEAIEMHDQDALLNTVLDVVDACTFNTVDIAKLPTHLVDYIYLKIHLKSTGKTQTASYTCGNVVDGVHCPGAFQLQLPLDKADLVYPEKYAADRIVWVDERKGIGIKMKCPSFDELKKIDLSQPVLNVTDKFIMTCIESVFTKDAVLVPGADFTVQECIEWFDELDGSVLRQVSNFFDQMPYVGLKLPVTCPICKRKEELELKGIQDFFV